MYKCANNEILKTILYIKCKKNYYCGRFQPIIRQIIIACCFVRKKKKKYSRIKVIKYHFPCLCYILFVRFVQLIDFHVRFLHPLRNTLLENMEYSPIHRRVLEGLFFSTKYMIQELRQKVQFKN